VSVVATTTIDTASQPDALQGPSRLGVIGDALRGVDEGEKLDPKAAETARRQYDPKDDRAASRLKFFFFHFHRYLALYHLIEVERTARLRARIVRAYNEVGYNRMRDDAHRAGERLGIPLAGDDAQALKMAVRLVQDAGHEPVVVGGLARAREFDYGTPVFGRPMTAAELRKALGLNP